MRRAIIRELKKEAERKGVEKFELVDGSFQGWALLSASWWRSVGATSALES